MQTINKSKYYFFVVKKVPEGTERKFLIYDFMIKR